MINLSSSGLKELNERQAESESRLARVERVLAELHDEVQQLSAHVRGDGKDGLLSQVRLNQTQLESIEKQWKWILRALLANLIVAIKATFFG